MKDHFYGRPHTKIVKSRITGQAHGHWTASLRLSVSFTCMMHPCYKTPALDMDPFRLGRSGFSARYHKITRHPIQGFGILDDQAHAFLLNHAFTHKQAKRT